MAKKKIPLIHYNITHIDDYQTLTETARIKKLVFDRLIESMTEGIAKNSKEISIFKINDTDEVLNLEKKDWKNTLENALSFYTETEDYEKCIDCKKLIDSLK